MKLVGIFEVEEDGKGKWKFTNTLTGIIHRTFGTWKEIEEIATTQSEAWKKRFAANGKGVLTKGRFQRDNGGKIPPKVVK